MMENKFHRKEHGTIASNSVENIDEQLREYRRMLGEHHRYTEKLRARSSLGIDSMDEKKRANFNDTDRKKNLLHRQLLELADKIGKSSSDVMVDLLLLDGGLRDYKLDLPILTSENSAADMRVEWQSSSVMQDYQPIGHNEVALIVGTETGDQYDLEGKMVSTHLMNEPVVESYTFSSGFTERISGMKKFIAEHPESAQFFATGAFLFHGSTRSYGIIIKKSELLNVAATLRDNREKYLPVVKSESIRINIPIAYNGPNSEEEKAKFKEVIDNIPDEMLNYDDLGERMGDEAALEYVKKRWGKD